MPELSLGQCCVGALIVFGGMFIVAGGPFRLFSAAMMWGERVIEKSEKGR